MDCPETAADVESDDAAGDVGETPTSDAGETPALRTAGETPALRTAGETDRKACRDTGYGRTGRAVSRQLLDLKTIYHEAQRIP